MVNEKGRSNILNILDRIMSRLNKMPWESITLVIFKYWCDLLLFQNMLHVIINGDNSSENLIHELNIVSTHIFKFFFRGLLHFRKMNIKIVDANINAQKFQSSAVSSKEEFLTLSSERIRNCETLQDLIDGSPNAECPICLEVTFTESTHFVFRISCNHLVCYSCEEQAAKFSKLVNKIK